MLDVEQGEADVDTAALQPHQSGLTDPPLSTALLFDCLAPGSHSRALSELSPLSSTLLACSSITAPGSAM